VLDHAAPLLELRGVCAGYGGAPIVRGIDLDVRAGEIVAVLGANGAGKTTVNKAISGLIGIVSGKIWFSGMRIDRAKPQAIVDLGLVQVPEGRKIFPNLTVEENIDLGSYRRGRSNRAQARDRVYQIFPRLRERTTQRAGTLSGGEQQMLAIGRGLMAQPQLLILDEPSLGLSPLLVQEMFALIRRINEDGLSILLVEQNVVQSLEIADRAFVMENGQVVMAGEAAALAADPALEKAYLGM
jgi:branched-chain amino acid transport system ATP-binding protein